MGANNWQNLEIIAVFIFNCDYGTWIPNSPPPTLKLTRHIRTWLYSATQPVGEQRCQHPPNLWRAASWAAHGCAVKEQALHVSDSSGVAPLFISSSSFFPSILFGTVHLVDHDTQHCVSTLQLKCYQKCIYPSLWIFSCLSPAFFLYLPLSHYFRLPSCVCPPSWLFFTMW